MRRAKPRKAVHLLRSRLPVPSLGTDLILPEGAPSVRVALPERTTSLRKVTSYATFESNQVFCLGNLLKVELLIIRKDNWSNFIMARGWESKSIEQQQSDALGERSSPRPRLSAADQKRNRHRDTLLLARKGLAAQLDSSQSPRHRQMLQQSLAEIDRQLSSFDGLTDAPAPK
jgi:hypothetical protein